MSLTKQALRPLGQIPSHLIATMTDLEERGIGFKSLTENIDTTSGGKLIFHIFGTLAEFERNLIRERTQASLIAARAREKRGGRPQALTARQLGIARDLYEKRHPIQTFAGPSRSPKLRCTDISRSEKESSNSQHTRFQALPSNGPDAAVGFLY